MADLLSATSLLLAALTIFYSLWYAEFDKAIHRAIAPMAANRQKDYQECRATFLFKMVPLCLVTVVLLLINLPVVLEITGRGFAHNVAAYDPVATIFVVVMCVLMFLAAHAVYSAIALASRVWRLNPKRGDRN